MRSRNIVALLAIIIATLFSTSLALAQKDNSKKAETITCPVTGEEVLKSEAVGPYAYQGVNYYFCCNGCLEKFKKDPETYLNKTKDIICGMDVDKRTAIKVSYEGKDFYFCSAGCKAAFEKDPKSYAMKALKTSKVHEHGENCDGCGSKLESTDKKGCCGDKSKAEKSSKTKI